MMIHSLSFYSSSSKTDQIMSRYRPIAPRPELPFNPLIDSTSSLQTTQQSPLFRNFSPLFGTKPTRTRKRSRAGLSPLTHKRPRTHLLQFSSPCHVPSIAPKTHLGIPLQGFAHGYPGFPVSAPTPEFATAPADLVTLPLLPFRSAGPVVTGPRPPEPECSETTKIDLNLNTAIPEEKDLLHKLQEQTCSNVIAPQPVRPVGSSISVGCISEDPSSTPNMQVKRPEEVEEDVESEALPAVVSDSNNRVRLANSAYKELVGQPECVWLDSMANSDQRLKGSGCRRIGGGVVLDLPDSTVPSSTNGFSCKVRIEWGSNGQKKSSISAPCDVSRLSCHPKDYLFAWRFHTREVSESSSRV